VRRHREHLADAEAIADRLREIAEECRRADSRTRLLGLDLERKTLGLLLEQIHTAAELAHGERLEASLRGVEDRLAHGSTGLQTTSTAAPFRLPDEVS
jgi:hypothetical protein